MDLTKKGGKMEQVMRICGEKGKDTRGRRA